MQLRTVIKCARWGATRVAQRITCWQPCGYGMQIINRAQLNDIANCKAHEAPPRRPRAWYHFVRSKAGTCALASNTNGKVVGADLDQLDA